MRGAKTLPGSTGRIEYLDLAKAIGMILVIAGHVVSSDTATKRIIYSFHMPLFFLLSGMLLKVRTEYNKGTWIQLIIKKAKRLLIPFILWGLIYSSFSLKHTVLILYGTRETLIAAESLTSLWFLPVMFLAYLFCEGVLPAGWLKNKWMGIVMSIVAFAVIGFLCPHYPVYGDPWGFDIAFIAAAFMLIGMLIRACLDKLSNIKYQIVALIISTALFIIIVRFSGSSVGYVLMANAEYGNILVFFLCALVGSSMILALSCLIAGKYTRWLQPVGQKTLGIFLVHKPIVELGRSIVVRMGFSFDHPIFIMIITAVALSASYIIVTIIQMIIPEIVGLKQITERGKT